MNTEYQLKHAREILEPCGVLGKYLSLDERGVWPTIERDMTMQADTELLRWRPARELQGLPGAPEVSDTPMLPMPFNARELAAFMLAGTGALVADFYGDWEGGPDPQSLSQIDPDSNARLAVVEAFDAYRLAMGVVGDMGESVKTRMDAPCKAPAAFNFANKAWLNAMVQCLLEVAPVTQAAQGAPAVAVAEPLRPVALTTSDIANAFAGLKWQTEAAWKKPLGDKPKWLEKCMVTTGVQGVSQTTWNPVLIAADLVTHGYAKPNQARAKFQTVHQLKPWLDAWRTYEADNFDTL